MADFARPVNKLHAALIAGIPLTAVFGAGALMKGRDLYAKKQRADEEMEQLKQQTIPLLLATTLGSGALTYNAIKDARRVQNKYSCLCANATDYLVKKATLSEISKILKERSPEALRKYFPYALAGAAASPLAYYGGKGLLGEVYNDEEDLADKYIPLMHAINTLGPLAGVAAGGLVGYGAGLTSSDVHRDYRRRPYDN